MAKIEKFNVRVYGLLVANSHVLISHEFLRNASLTKFPGGGLHFGESPSECLEREFLEELKLQIRPIRFFCTPDFVVHNYFKPEEQVIVLYYLVAPLYHSDLFKLNMEAKNSESLYEVNRISHEWIPIEKLHPEIFTFPADKFAASLLIKNPQEFQTS